MTLAHSVLWRRAASTAVASALLLAGSVRADSTALQPPASPANTRQWVELTPRGAEARWLVAGDAPAPCPPAVIDGQARPMQLRADPGPGFAVSVCESDVPAGAASLSIQGVSLPLPKAQPQRILIFGDTGCRLKGADVQDCDNPPRTRNPWRFATVAKLAAAHHPDLVIHVGDYYYRETPCPPDHASDCGNSPSGDQWASWDADFFTPATPLLAAAPWVMVRGNHESCKRGGAGWFRLLDAAPAPLPCPAVSAPFTVPIGGLNLYVIDSADAEDASAPADAVARMSAQLDALAGPLQSEPGWILTHRPIWGLAPVAPGGPPGPTETPLDLTEQTAVRGRDLSAVTMIVSGHIHHFASFSFGPARPAQLIVGTGGDVGDPGDTPAFRAETPDLDGLRARNFGFDRYGFLILERDGEAWAGAFYDVNDRVIARCRLIGRALACAKA